MYKKKTPPPIVGDRRRINVWLDRKAAVNLAEEAAKVVLSM